MGGSVVSDLAHSNNQVHNAALQTVVTAEGLSLLQHAMEGKNVPIVIGDQMLEVQFLPKPTIMVDCNGGTDWIDKLDIQ